jgi:hypothetical protein
MATSGRPSSENPIVSRTEIDGWAAAYEDISAMVSARL